MRGLVRQQLGRGDLEGAVTATATAPTAATCTLVRACRRRRGDRRGHGDDGGFLRHDDQVLLDGLEGGDGPAELPALVDVGESQFAHRLQRPGHRHDARQCAPAHQGIRVDAGGGGSEDRRLDAVQVDRVARLASEVDVGFDAYTDVGCRYGDDLPAVVGTDERHDPRRRTRPRDSVSSPGQAGVGARSTVEPQGVAVPAGDDGQRAGRVDGEAGARQ